MHEDFWNDVKLWKSMEGPEMPLKSLRERSQSVKATACMLPTRWHSWKGKMMERVKRSAVASPTLSCTLLLCSQLYVFPVFTQSPGLPMPQHFLSCCPWDGSSGQWYPTAVQDPDYPDCKVPWDWLIFHSLTFNHNLSGLEQALERELLDSANKNTGCPDHCR